MKKLILHMRQYNTGTTACRSSSKLLIGNNIRDVFNRSKEGTSGELIDMLSDCLCLKVPNKKIRENIISAAN